MSSKSGTKNIGSSIKQVVSKGLTSTSVSAITSQSSALVQQKTNVRATSAKYYDIASKILSGSGDVEELFLSSAKNGNYQKLEQLLQQNSEIGLNINCADKRTGNTALIWASKRGHSKAAELLLRYGADATVCNYEAHTALETAFLPAKTIVLDWVETQEELSERLLLQAAWQGNLSIVRKVLQNKSHINLNCQNAEGLTPLMLVCRDIQLFERLFSQLNRHYSPVQVAEELIKSKADILVTDSDGRSCLHYAAQSHSGSADSMTVALMAGGFDMELCDKHLLTPLHLASQSGNTNNVVALADRGSDVNAKGFAGLTPLHLTVWYRLKPNLLFKEPFGTLKLNLLFKEPISVMEDSIKYFKLYFVLYGLDSWQSEHPHICFSTCASNHRKISALKDHHATALTLMKYGADVTIVDDHGSTPLDMARNRKMKNSLKEAWLLATTKDSNPPSDTTGISKNVDVDEEMKKSETAKKSDEVVGNASKTSTYSQTAKPNQSKILSNVDRCKQVESKILQEVEAFKAAHPVLQRETTRMLGTPRTNILPQIRRSSSPEQSCKLSQVNMDSMSSPSKGSEGLQRSLDETQNKLTSRGKSVLDIKLGLGRTSKKSSTGYVNQEAPKDLCKSAHRRSDSDPSSPHIRELTASCDSLLACTNGKKIVQLKNPDLSLSRDLPTSLNKIQKERHHSEKGLSHPEGILQSMGSPSEILRNHTFLKEEFILEESRPKEISSGSDPSSSLSSCSQSSSSPRDISFIQPSPSRSIRRDPSLSTLLEQHASTHFSVPDSFVNSDGKPLILKPQKKLRKRSDNSLSSSLESDTDDLRIDIVITRSDSLRKSRDRTSSNSQESTNLCNPLPVFKSQSMESISPRAQPKIIEELPPSSLVAAKSNSEGNLDTAEQGSMQTAKSKFCETATNKNFAKSKAPQAVANVPQAAAKCIKPSKKHIIGPFLGKTKVESNTKTEIRNSSSPTVVVEKRIICSKTEAFKTNITQKLSQNSCEKVGLGRKDTDSLCSIISTETQQGQGQGRNKPQPQKPNSAAEVKPVLINANDSSASSTKAAKLQALTTVPTSVKISKSQEQFKSADTLHQSDPTTQFGPGNMNTDVCLSSTTSKSSISNYPVGKVCEDSRANIVLSEESNQLGNKSNQKFGKLDSLDKSKTREAGSMKVKSSIKDNTKDKTDSKEIQKISLKYTCQVNTNMPPSSLFDTTQPTPIVGASSATNSSIIAAKPLQQGITNIARNETSSKSVTSEGNVTCSEKAQQLSKMQEESETLKCSRKDQDSKKLALNFLKCFYTSKPNIQLKTMSLEPSVTNKLQPTAAKINEDTDRIMMNNDLIHTPVIVNPFEEFVQAHIKVIDNSSTDVPVKVKKPNPNKIISKNVKKTATTLTRKKLNSGILRQVSAGRKQSAKGKDLNTEKESRPRTGRKSAKGQQSKKTEKITKSKINVDTLIPNKALISGNGWQLSTSCVDKSIIEASSDLHLYSSDSDFSLDLEEHESLSHEDDNSKDKTLSKNFVQAFRENTTEDIPINVEVKNHTNFALNTKLSEAVSDNLSSMDLDMTQDIHNTNKDHNEKDYKSSTNISSQRYPKSIDDQKDLCKITPIPEQSSFDASNLTSTFEMTNKDFPLHHDDIPHYDKEESQRKISKDVNTNIEFPQDLDNFEHQNINCIINDKVEEQMVVNYEYTPLGKIVRRTQSLKDFQKQNILKPELKFSQNHGQKTIAEKTGDKKDDIDDIIEEILSSTTSSVSSITRNVKAQGLGSRILGVHSVTDSDKSILLKMSSSKFSSPFHAKISTTSKMCSEDVVDDLSEVDISPKTLSPSIRLSSSPSTEDTGEQITTTQELKQTLPAKEVKNHGSAAVVASSKPPPPSFKEVGAPRSVTVRKSSSTREGRRHQLNAKNGNKVTEEEAQHLVKILRSFKNMELQVGANCDDKPSRNTLTCNDQSSVNAGASFRSKHRFQELKVNSRARISTEFMETPTTGLNKGSHQCLDACQSRVPDSRNTTEDIKCEDGDIIQWKKGNVLGRGAFGTVWCGLTSEGQLIAVKQIELTTIDKSKAQHEYEHVQVEVEILKTLEHENIVSYLGTSLEDNIVSIFMQFIPGGSIACILARFGALEESVFRIYTKQILEGVKYLHANDVIHRDIKGANIMLMHNGVIKLIDFGCAKRLCFNLSISQTELLKSMNGTPFWMAPEVVNESGHGKKSDIWSIGCTVFEMATIKPPWSDMNPMAAIFAIGSLSRPVPTLGSKFSHDARDFVSRCMTRDQDARPGASELQEHPFITRQTNTRPSMSND